MRNDLRRNPAIPSPPLIATILARFSRRTIAPPDRRGITTCSCSKALGSSAMADESASYGANANSSNPIDQSRTASPCTNERTYLSGNPLRLNVDAGAANSSSLHRKACESDRLGDPDSMLAACLRSAPLSQPRRRHQCSKDALRKSPPAVGHTDEVAFTTNSVNLINDGTPNQALAPEPRSTGFALDTHHRTNRVAHRGTMAAKQNHRGRSVARDPRARGVDHMGQVQSR